MKFPRLLLMLALCLGLALALPAIAAEEGAGAGAGGAAEAQQAPSAQPPPAGEAAPQAEMKEVEGNISSIDMQNQTVRVGGFAGLFGTDLQVTDQTKFVPAPGAEAADLASLKEGDRIRASYQKVDDRNVASEIVVVSPAAGEAAPEAAPEGGAGGAPPAEQPAAPQEGAGRPSY